MGCLGCGRGLHDECETVPCCCDPKELAALTSNPLATAVRTSRMRKMDEDVKDPHSTGRKRAAEDYPLDKNALCEWNQLKNCGGGKHPIIGCYGNKQAARHHGPDKSTLNNSEGNVHRICHFCHTRWHYFNDADMDITIVHNPETATLEEILDNEIKWSTGSYKNLTSKRLARLDD